MARNVARGAMLVLGLAASLAGAQYDDLNFEDMMGGYGDYGYGGGYGGYGGYGGMGDMMPGLAGMMGGMGGGYGGYGGYGNRGPAHKDLDDKDAVDKFMFEDPETPAVIGFYNEDIHSDQIMAFTTTASRMSQMGIRFGLATEDDILESLKYTAGRVMAYPAKRFMAEGDRPKQRYPGGSLDPEPLQMWITKACTPLVGLYTWKSGMIYQDIGLPELMACTEVDLEEKEKGAKFDEIAAILRRVASARPGKDISYTIADYEGVEGIISRFQFPDEKGEDGDRKTAVGIRKENSFYRMDGEFSEENVAKFVDDFVKGELKPFHVEEVPDEAGMGMDDIEEDEDDVDEEHVVVLTPSNFEDVVRDEGKDVMLEFYAPWCGHCKQLKPVYAEVASEVSEMSSVVVAKMDASAHTPPSDFKIQSYPTLMFVKAGDKSNPIPYEGSRDKESMVAFIKENVTPSAEAAAPQETA